MIRVLHIGKFLPPVKGGMETAIYNICDALSLNPDIHVRLVGSNTNNSHEHVKIRNQFEIVKLKTAGVFFSTPLSFGLLSEIRDFNPDIIHLHLPNPWFEFLLLFAIKKPLVITYHCDVKSYPLLQMFYNWIMKKTLLASKYIIATSNNIIKSSYSLSQFEHKCQVISLPISSSFPTRIKKDLVERIKKLYGESMVLFVGRLVKYKGLDRLLPLMRKTKAHLVIIGKGPEEEVLLKKVIHYKLQNQVSLVGGISDNELPSYYEASRAVILPSIDDREALGMCLIEGLSLKRPLITTDLRTGVTEVNLNGKTGYTVSLDNLKEFPDKINLLLGNDATWEYFSRNAYQHYLDNFDSHKIAEKHIELYKKVLS